MPAKQSNSENQFAASSAVDFDLASDDCDSQEIDRLVTMGRLLSSIAHSAGTPLNIISGYAEFLMMRLSSDEISRKELSAIVDQTRRLASLFTEALEMGKPPREQKEMVEVGKVLSDSIELASHQFRKMSLRAELTCATSLPLIYGEATQLKQAVFNLLLNVAHRVGSGGKLDLKVNQSDGAPSSLSVELKGFGQNGNAADFSPAIQFLREGKSTDHVHHRLGLSLARAVLRDVGAEIVGQDSTGPFLLLIRIPAKV